MILRDHSGEELPLEEGGCALCGRRDGVPEHAEGKYRMLRCGECGLRYASPRPTAEGVAALYTGYLPDGDGDGAAWDRAMRSVFERAARRLDTLVGAPGRILDVGCGFGSFLETMERRGWEVYGIEASERGAGRANARLRQGAVHRGFFPEGLPDLPPLDVVTAFYVLEHAREPLAFLRAARDRLAPGGRILLRIPHTAPLKKLLGWIGVRNRLYDLPAHLFDYSPDSMRRLLAAAGFEEIALSVGGATSFGGAPRRILSAVAGALGEAAFRANGGRSILPGLSYTALARKPAR